MRRQCWQMVVVIGWMRMEVLFHSKSLILIYQKQIISQDWMELVDGKCSWQLVLGKFSSWWLFFCNFKVFFIYFKVVSWCFAFGKCIWQLVFGKCRLVGICGNALQAGEWPRPLDSKLDLCLGHFQRMFTPVHHYSTLHYNTLHCITLHYIMGNFGRMFIPAHHYTCPCLHLSLATCQKSKS